MMSRMHTSTRERFKWQLEALHAELSAAVEGKADATAPVTPDTSIGRLSRMFPVLLLPACVGLLALSVGTAPWIAFVYLILAGVSQGIASPMMTALWAEVYGVESLGATKGTVATFGIFATALGRSCWARC
jgi:hypothetical protein